MRIRSVAAAAVVALLLIGATVVPESFAAGGQSTSTASGHASAGTDASSPITAHDGKFWAGTQPIVFHGVNSATPCCSASGYGTIQSQGMNFVRLWVRWTGLEPNPPVKNSDGTWTHTYDATYLGQVEASISNATAKGLYVLVDNHPDGKSTFYFPNWLYQAPYNSHGVTYQDTSSGIAQAAADFWSDPLRQQFMTDMWGYLAGHVVTPGIAGYEVLNEPDQGNLSDSHATTQTIVNEQLAMAQAIRAVDPITPIVFTTRRGYAPGLAAADLSEFTALGNVAFDVHDYFGARWSYGLRENPSDPLYNEYWQFLYDSPVSGFVSHIGGTTYLGTTAGQVRFVQNLLNTLTPLGIPLLVGEFGDDGTADPGVYNFFGTTTAAFHYLGVSWATYQTTSLGIQNDDGTYRPWAQIVIDAAGQPS